MGRAPRAFLAILVGCAGCLGAAAEDAARAPAPSLSFDGLHLTQFRGAVPVLRLDAHQLRVVPWQLGVLRVGPLRRALLTRVRCEVMEMGAGADPGAPVLAGIRPGRLGVEAAPAVVGVTLEDLQCTVLRDGVRVARVSASRAELAGASGRLLLHQLVVTRLPAGPELTADRGTWDPDESVIAIRGAWELADHDGVRRGRGLRTDLELRQVEPPHP